MRGAGAGRGGRVVSLCSPAVLSALLVALLGIAGTARAQSGETGSVCVQDFAENVACSGDEIVAQELVVEALLEDCDEGQIGSALAVLDVVVANGPSAHFDLALFVALQGGSALDGPACYHDYLAPPLDANPVYGDDNSNAVPDIRNGPWADLEPFAMPTDECGDIDGGTEVIRSLASESVPIRIACVDEDGDGNLDASVCVGWRNGTQGSCRSLSDAIAEASPRCSCRRVEITGLPEPGLAIPLVGGALLLGVLARRPRGSRRRAPG